jgi:hypothetical protein
MKVAVLTGETWIVLAAGAASAVVAAIIAWLMRDRRDTENVTIGFLGPSLAAIYLLVLALALATEWQTISSAQQAVGNEAVAIRQVYWSAAGLPAPTGTVLRAQVRDYLVTVLHHDWPEVESGNLDGQSLTILTAMSTSVLRANVVTSGAANAQQFAISQLSALAVARAQRENVAGSRLPLGVLVAVIVTSLFVCVFPFACGVRSPASIAMAILQAALVTIAVVVVLQLNNPFTGPLATGPGPLTEVAAEVGVQ